MKIVYLALCLAFLGCSSRSDKTEDKTPPVSGGEISVIEGGAQKSDNVSPFTGYSVTGENMVRFAPDGQETAVTKAIGAHVVIKNHPYETIQKSLLAKRLSKIFIVKCSACHDDYANGVIGPSLLDKSGDEIYNMIIKYRTDKEKNVMMKVLVSKMTEKEIRFIADDLANFNAEIRAEGKKNE